MSDISNIAYKNIYYILMYAIKELRGAKLRNIDTEDFKALNDLYAAIMSTSMMYVIQSGVLQEYNRITDVSNKPKGKLDIDRSLKTGSYQRSLMASKYYQLNVDNDYNRTIKLALKILLKYGKGIKKERTNTLRNILTFMNKVSDVMPRDLDFRNIDTTHLSVEYKTAVYMSKLIIEESITKEDGSHRRLIESEDINRMSTIFENFVRNYYIFNYKSRYIKVSAKELGVEETRYTYFNKSRTDVTIENKQNNNVLIIDTKWYKEILTKYKRVNTDNERQVKDYVRDYNDELGTEDTFITGVLLYAKPNNEEINTADIEEAHRSLTNKRGHVYGQINTRIIDLEQEFKCITDKLDLIFNTYVM